MKRPYVALGCDQSGRVTPTNLTGWRSGVVCGACWGTLLVCLLVGGLRSPGLAVSAPLIPNPITPQALRRFT